MQIDTKSDAILLGFKKKEHLMEFAKKEPEKYAKLFPIILQARKRFNEIEQEFEQDFLKVFDGFDIKGFMKEFDRNKWLQNKILKEKLAKEWKVQLGTTQSVFDNGSISGATIDDTTISNSSQKRVFKQEGVNGSTEKIITNLESTMESTIVFIQEQGRQITNLEKDVEELSVELERLMNQ
jgi:hypothetical protein